MYIYMYMYIYIYIYLDKSISLYYQFVGIIKFLWWLYQPMESLMTLLLPVSSISTVIQFPKVTVR